jgi:hypothetical protein
MARALVPEDLNGGRKAAANSFIRAVISAVVRVADGKGESVDHVAARLWPSDREVARIAKAASSPASLAVTGWAGILGHTGQNLDVIAILAPASVAAGLLTRCMRLSWPPGVQQISIPTINVTSSAASWIGEGSPLGVYDFITSAVALTPKKIGTAVLFSREMAQHSVPDLETLLRAALAESLGLLLDSTLLGTSATGSASPPGIFAGLTPLVASTQTIATEAMTADISNLIATVAAIAVNHEIVLIMSPRQAAAMRVRTDIDYATFASPALPDGTIAAIATNALASIGDPTPQFTASFEAAFHMADPASPLVDTGGAVASPGRSIFQTDCLALKLTCSINWILRHPSGAALIQNATW